MCEARDLLRLLQVVLLCMLQYEPLTAGQCVAVCVCVCYSVTAG